MSTSATADAGAARSLGVRPPSPLVEIGVPLAVFLVALAARLYHLSGESVWLDEAYSYEFANPDFSHKQVVWATGSDFHPPLYYLILHFSLQFGSDLFWLRLPSVVFGALAAGATAVAGRIVAGPAAGMLAGLLYALAPIQVAYGQEARMYALLSFQVGAGLAAFLWLASDRSRLFASPMSVLRLRCGIATLGCWLVVSMAMGGAMLTHNLGVYFPMVVAIAVLAIWALSPGRRLHELASFMVFSGLGLLLWLPWVPYLLKQMRLVHSGYWITFPSAGSVVTDFAALLFGTGSAVLGIAATLAGMAVVALVAFRKRDMAATLALLLLFAIGPVVLALLVSLWRPLYLSRTLVWVAIPAFVAIASAVVNMPRRAQAAFLSVAFVAVTAYQLRLHYAVQTKPGWQQVIDHLQVEWQDGDAIVIHRASAALPFNFHRHLLHPDVSALPEPLGVVTPLDASIEKLPPGTRRVWVIYSYEGQDDKDRRVLKTFSDRGRIIESQDFGGSADLGRPSVTLVELN